MEKENFWIENGEIVYCGHTMSKRKILKFIKERVQLKAENERLISQLGQAKEIIDNPEVLISQQKQLIESLQRQLKEKDEEIAEVKRQLKETKDLHEIERFYLVNQAKQFDKMRKTSTKQVCEKIRKKQKRSH